MSNNKIKSELKKMGVSFDEMTILSERVPNLFFTFCKKKQFSTRYFKIDDSGLYFTEISEKKFYELGQKILREKMREGA